MVKAQHLYLKTSEAVNSFKITAYKRRWSQISGPDYLILYTIYNTVYVLYHFRIQGT